MWRNLSYSLLAVFLAVAAFAYEPEGFRKVPERSGESIYQTGKGHGWYWYEMEAGKQVENGTEQAVPYPSQPVVRKRFPSLRDYTYEQLWRMPPDEFQRLLKAFLAKAVTKMTPEAVKEYLVMQSIAKKRATAFAALTEFVYQTTPGLSNADTYYITSPGVAKITAEKLREFHRVLDDSGGGRYGLVMFYRSGCGFCDAQWAILQHFRDKYRWDNIKLVDVEKRPLLAERFGVEITPTIILIERNSDRWFPISVGVVSVMDLERKVYRAIRYLEGEVKPEQWFMYEYQRETAADPLKKIFWQVRGGER